MTYILGQRPWTPEELTTVALWLDANQESSLVKDAAGDVSSWTDRSTYGDSYTQGTAIYQPRYSAAGWNGLPCVLFGSQKAFNNLTHLDGSYSNTTAEEWSVFMIGNQNNGNQFLQRCVDFSAAGARADTRSGTSQYENTFWSGTYRCPGANNVSGDKLLQWDYTTNGSVYRNTVAVGTGTWTYTNTALNGNTAIGGPFGAAGGQGHLNARVGEILMIEGGASGATKELIEGYLAHKWSKTDLLPGGHPYKTQPPYA